MRSLILHSLSLNKYPTGIQVSMWWEWINFYPYLGCLLERGNSVLRLLTLERQYEGGYKRRSITSMISHPTLSIGSTMIENFRSSNELTTMLSQWSQNFTPYKRLSGGSGRGLGPTSLIITIWR